MLWATMFGLEVLGMSKSECPDENKLHNISTLTMKQNDYGLSMMN